jgi:thioredoxin-related protein
MKYKVLIISVLFFLAINYIYQIYSNNPYISYPSMYNNCQVNHRLYGCKEYLVNANKKNMTVLFFTSKGCAPCRKMKKTIWPHESIQVSVSYYNNSPKMLNSSNKDHVSDFNRYKIKFVPTTIIVDKEGKEIKRSVGYIGVKKLLEFLN